MSALHPVVFEIATPSRDLPDAADRALPFGQLDRGDIDAWGGQYGNALYAASRCGHEKIDSIVPCWNCMSDKLGLVGEQLME